MSYMRGEYYVYVSAGEHQAACSKDCQDPAHEVINIYTGGGSAFMPLSVFDELVAMRHAELVAEGRWLDTMKRTIETHGSGNFGMDALLESAGRETTAEELKAWAATLPKEEHIYPTKEDE